MKSSHEKYVNQLPVTHGRWGYVVSYCNELFPQLWVMSFLLK